MEIRTEYESPLKLDKLLIPECHFVRSEDNLDGLTLNVDVTKYVERIEDNKYKVVLLLAMMDEAKKVALNVKCLAYFTTLQDNFSMLSKNAVAIMFPYVRSYVSTLTTQPGMSPIVLPPMNIAAMFHNGQDS
jgi:preprotein translocase subunit SecB